MIGVALVALLELAHASQTPAIVVTSFGGIGDAPGAIGTKNTVVREQFKDSNGLATAQTTVATDDRTDPGNTDRQFILTRPDTIGSNDPDEVGPHVYIRTNGQQPYGQTSSLPAGGATTGEEPPLGGHDLLPIYNPGKIIVPVAPGNPANNADIVIPVTGVNLDAAAYDDDVTLATGSQLHPGGDGHDARIWMHLQLCSSRGKQEAWVRPGCGDGITTAPEECDDGNNINNDGCNIMCGTEPVGAASDVAASLGDHSTCTGPSGLTQTATPCGTNAGTCCCRDSTLGDFECSACGCWNGHLLLATCGNGVLDDGVGGEQCDDGNTFDGDGCSNACTLEQPNRATVVTITSDVPRSAGEPDLPWPGNANADGDRHTAEFLSRNAHPFVAHPTTDVNEVCDCRCDETTLTATAGAADDLSGTGGYNAFTFNWAPVAPTDSTSGTWTIRGSELDRMIERVGEADYAVCSCSANQDTADDILGGVVAGAVANIGSANLGSHAFPTRQPQPHIVMAGDGTLAPRWQGAAVAGDARTEFPHPPDADFNSRDGTEGVFESYTGLNEASVKTVVDSVNGITPGISRNLVPILQVRWGCNADTDCYDEDVTRTAPADQRSRNCEFSHRQATLPPGIAAGTVQNNVPVVPFQVWDGSVQQGRASGLAPLGTVSATAASLNKAIKNPHWERDVASCKLATQCLPVAGSLGARSGVCVRPQDKLPPQDRTQACGLHLFESSWGKCCNAGTHTVYPNTVHETPIDTSVTAGLPVFHCPVSHPQDTTRTIASRANGVETAWPADLPAQQQCPTGELPCFFTKYDARFPTPPLMNARENSVDWPESGKPWYSSAPSPDLYHWGVPAGQTEAGSLEKIPAVLFGEAVQSGYLQPDYLLQTNSRFAFPVATNVFRHDLDRGVFESGALEGHGLFQPLPVPPTGFNPATGAFDADGVAPPGADTAAGTVNGKATDMVNRVFRCYNPNYEQCCDDGQVYNPAINQCCRVGGVQAVDSPCPCNDDFDCSRPNTNGESTPNVGSEPNMRCCMQTSPPAVLTTQANLCSRYMSFNTENGVFGNNVNTNTCMGKCINTDYQICCNGNTCRGEFERCCNTTCCNRYSETCVEASQGLDDVRKAWFWQANNVFVESDQCTGIEFLHTVRAFWVYVFPAFLLFGVLATAAAAITFVSHQAMYPLTWSEIILILLATFQGVWALPIFFSPQWKYAAVLTFSAFWAIAVGASRRNYFYLLLVISQFVLLMYCIDPFGGNQYLNFSSGRAADGVTQKFSSGILPSLFQNWADPGNSVRSPNANYLDDAATTNNDLQDGFNTIAGWGTSAVHTPCTTFYNYFLLDNNLLDVDREHNPDEQFFGYCTRGWILFLMFMGVLSTVFAFWVFVAALLAVITKVIRSKESQDEADIVELNIARKIPDYMSSEIPADQ